MPRQAITSSRAETPSVLAGYCLDSHISGISSK